MGIIILIIFFAVAWFLLIVPRQRELRRHQAVVAQIGPGDEVVTSSGVYGTIRAVEGDVVRLEIAPGIEIKIAKRAVAAMAPAADTAIDTGLVDLTEDDEPTDGTDRALEAEPGDRPDGNGA